MSLYTLFFSKRPLDDTMAEWLRRRMQVPLGSARVGSNPARVAIFFFKKSLSHTDGRYQELLQMNSSYTNTTYIMECHHDNLVSFFPEN